jgi:flagellar hook-associated protein 2
MTALTTISGAVSGLDTASIINSLVSVQTNQQTLLKSQQKSVQTRADAYTSLAASLTSLSTQAADLAKTSAWAGSTATSSSTSVTATSTGTTSASISFDVTAVAARHSLISSGSVASTGSIVASSGPLTLTDSSGRTTNIEVGTGSLSDVVAAINGSKSGIVAVAVQTSPGAFRLQVSSSTTGAASSFTLDGLDGFTSMDTLTEGSDAAVHIGGTSAAAYDATSASNTFSTLVPNLSFTVSKLETGVTVGATVDGSKIADKINSLVTSANSILTDIAAKTSYDVTTKSGGPFVGESTVRSLQQNVLSAVSGTGAPGVSLTRDGKLTFDRQKFLDAFVADPAAVARTFGATGTFAASDGVTSTSATVTSALPSTRAGSYAVSVSSLATQAQWTIDASGDVGGQEIALTRGTTSIAYTPDPGTSLADAASAFNERSAAAHFGVSATATDTGLQFTADAASSAADFSASLDGVDGQQDSVGADISGTIDGQDAKGLGNILSLATGTGGAVGLSVAVNSTDEDLAVSGGQVGSVLYTPGVAQRLVTLINDATASGTGSLATAQTGATAEIKRYQAQIDTWDARLTTYRASLTTQFTAMETALASLKSQSGALSSLTGSSSSSSSSSSG